MTFTIRKPEKPKGPNPILRGLGFMILSAFVIGGYLAGEWLLARNAERGWFYVPVELTGPPFAPMLFAKLVLTGVALLLGMMVLTILYGIVSPPQPGELDAPPVPSSGKKSR